MKFYRVAINGKFLSADPTGVHRVAEQLILQLAEKSCKLVDLFESEPRVIAPPDVRRASLDSFDVHRAGLFRGQLWEQVDLPRLTRSDLLLNLCNLGPIASTAAITMIHDAQVFMTPGSYPSAFVAWYRFVQPIIGRRHTRILTVSEYSAAQLARFGVARRDQISVIPNGADHLRCHNARRDIIDRLRLEARKFVVALANRQAHKNIGLLLKAFSDPTLNSQKLVLVGAESRAEFEAAGHQVPQNVVFAGRVDDGELRALFETALCTGFPSTTEGFGLPPLEGMSLGCPAILAPCGALPEIGGTAAMYAAANDPRQWVSAIKKMATDAGTRDQYSRAGLEQAGLFTWNRAGEKLIDLIRSVVSSERSA